MLNKQHYKTWSWWKSTFSDIFTSYFLLKSVSWVFFKEIYCHYVNSLSTKNNHGKFQLLEIFRSLIFSLGNVIGKRSTNHLVKLRNSSKTFISSLSVLVLYKFIRIYWSSSNVISRIKILVDISVFFLSMTNDFFIKISK